MSTLPNSLSLKASLKAPNVSVRFIGVYMALYLFIPVCKGAVSTAYFGYFMIFEGCELQVVLGTS
jgi:hypothetical protein